MSSEQRILTLIIKGYTYPHDIERLAKEIYELPYADKIKNKNIISDFILSVNRSEFHNIVEITFEYLTGLVESDKELLYKKIGHLFDSINIFIRLGLCHDKCIITKVDALIINLLTTRNGKVLFSNFSSDKVWWYRISEKYALIYSK
ncbi:hypothetical protein [Escherichia fergusonii]|uniref:hypothetical protein n=1 Tax=Escherichia fergusonii TaxID=564 RepID=UPI0015EF9A83|nr:hypothetical protein [Escherichia fergusonii]QMI37202.1 hypothetical protein HVY08_07700 [Escherichia fergusonii]QMI41267.1 hypothetical protein HVY07_07700 [Escherichia fergusonii]